MTMGRYYDIFKAAESGDSETVTESVRAALAELEPLSSMSQEIIEEFRGEPEPPREIGMADIRPFAAKFSRCDKRIALAVGVYCTMREAFFKKVRAMSFRKQIQIPTPDREDVARDALWLAWCRDTDSSEDSTPPDEFYRFLFSYKDAVVFLGGCIDAYILWLNMQSNGDKTWWGGVRQEYKEASALLNSALELATVDYALKC